MWDYVRIITGLSGTCSADGKGTNIHYVSPNNPDFTSGGLEKELPFETLRSRMDVYQRRYDEEFTRYVQSSPSQPSSAADKALYKSPSWFLFFSVQAGQQANMP